MWNCSRIKKNTKCVQNTVLINDSNAINEKNLKYK